jgi:hypothetical protein
MYKEKGHIKRIIALTAILSADIYALLLVSQPKPSEVVEWDNKKNKD